MEITNETEYRCNSCERLRTGRNLPRGWYYLQGFDDQRYICGRCARVGFRAFERFVERVASTPSE